SFPRPNVTGTEKIIVGGVLGKGTTIIDNAAREPEVVDLAESLTQMGARVTGRGSARIFIEGVSRLQPPAHDILPDRIEGGAFLVAAPMTGGDVTIDHCCPAHLGALLDHLRATGAAVEGGAEWAGVMGSERPYPIIF